MKTQGSSKTTKELKKGANIHWARPWHTTSFTPPSNLVQSCLTLWPRGLQPARLLCAWAFLGKNTGAGCHFLLQGIFPSQGLNSHLLHSQVGVLPLSHQQASQQPQSSASGQVVEWDSYKPRLWTQTQGIWILDLHDDRKIPSAFCASVGFPGGSAAKESACKAGDVDLIPGLGRSPGEEHGYPLQYSGLENPRTVVHVETESDMTDRLSLSLFPSVKNDNSSNPKCYSENQLVHVCKGLRIMTSSQLALPSYYAHYVGPTLYRK